MHTGPDADLTVGTNRAAASPAASAKDPKKGYWDGHAPPAETPA